jgi:hypothetical protein
VEHKMKKFSFSKIEKGDYVITIIKINGGEKND